MSTTTGTSILSLGLAALLAAPLMILGASDARADVGIRVRGRINLNLGAPVRVRHRHGHRHHHPRTHLRHYGLHVGGHVEVGYAEPPPPVVVACEPTVPAYYVEPPPAAVVGGPGTVAVVAPRRHRDRPRFGLGGFTGSVDNHVGGSVESTGEDAGLLARYRLTRSVELEAELGATEIVDRARVDQRLGAAVLWDLSPRSRLSPFLIAGAGVSTADLGDGAFRADQQYAEVGAGLNLRLSRRLLLALDLRAGQRELVEREARADSKLAASAATLPPIASEEDYTRARLSAVLYF